MAATTIFQASAADGSGSLFAPACDGAEFLTSYQGDAMTNADDAWMLATETGQQWAHSWTEPCWQNAALTQEWLAMLEYQQRQEWAAAQLVSRSWAAMDPNSNRAAAMAAEAVAKQSQALFPGAPWTDLSLDPEKPTTPASKPRAAARSQAGSEVKLPPPVGSGRHAKDPDAEKLAVSTTDVGEPWKVTSVSLSCPAKGDGAASRQPPALGTLFSSAADRAASKVSISSVSTADSSTCEGSNNKASRARDDVPQCTSEGDGVSTVMIRNVPSGVKQSAFVKELEDSGFQGLFDFCYLPSAFDTGKNKGYAFVNFSTSAAYKNFLSAWHGTRRFNARLGDPALNVSAAALQGLERNIEKWDAPRMRRVRNPEYRPFVVKNQRIEDKGKAMSEMPRSVGAEAFASPQRLPAPCDLVPDLLGSASIFQGLDLEVMPPPGLSLSPPTL